MQNEVLLELYKSLESGYKCMLVTLFDNKGSVPGKQGNIMVVREDGKVFGTVGGGAIEYQLIQDSFENLNKETDFEFDYSLNENSKVSMSCGGKASGFAKIFFPKPNLIIFGAGHCSQKLARIATLTNFDVFVVDDRKEFESCEDFSNIKKYINKEIKDSIKDLRFNADTYIISATRDHIHDEEVAFNVLSKTHRYFGMLGSKKKAAKLKQNLLDRNVDKNLVEDIKVPVGLDIDDGSVEEIAISIMSQILQVKNNKN
ncbi:XdhC family protein [uncultured Finegoldia sp.]|uniref:XdhC family protein n=1 Tax=uncultured Finegoldia sp. TaxID=328009 RepID=UPI00260EA19A|nr:XdhC/CoxI family protein [uncultured Finegoldia sp.]